MSQAVQQLRPTLEVERATPAPVTNQLSSTSPVTPATPTPVQTPVVRRPIYKRPLGWILLAAVLLLGAAGTAYWFYARQWESTDDAFVDGDVYPVSSKVAGQVQTVRVADNQLVNAGDVLAELDARDIQVQLSQAKSALDAAKADAEAAQTNIELTRATTAATLTQGHAGVSSANAAVETAKSQLASAQADVTSAQAEATRREADEKRYTSLDPRGVSQAQLDAAHAAADAARAQLTATQKRVAAAEAGVNEAQAKVSAAEGVLAAAQTAQQQIASAEAKARLAQAHVAEAQAQVDAETLNLSYTQIKAPVAGRVARKNIEPGQYIQVGQALLAVVPQDYFVTANFKETQLTQMHIGQPVDITVDAFPDHPLHGHVDSMQAGTGARFSLLPPENATGNYVKVVQRVPVKIVFDGKTGEDASARAMLGLGMSVTPEVRVSGESAVAAH